MTPKPTDAGAAAGAACGDFDAAEAAPEPANAATAAIDATIAAPRLIEIFLAISPSLSLSAFAREPQSLTGLCERLRMLASPFRGSRALESLDRVISAP